MLFKFLEELQQALWKLCLENVRLPGIVAMHNPELLFLLTFFTCDLYHSIWAQLLHTSLCNLWQMQEQCCSIHSYAGLGK